MSIRAPTGKEEERWVDGPVPIERPRIIMLDGVMPTK